MADALPDSEQITTMIVDWRGGNQSAGDQLFTLIHHELRRIATARLRLERPNHTLQATELVNELYVRLFGSDPVTWQNRAHLFAAAGQALRRILVDYARARQAGKRGGGQVRVSITSIEDRSARENSEDVLAVSEALDALLELQPRAARVVELRFFAGLSVEETAEVLGVSTVTVKRDWKFARAWLMAQLLPE
jgi:RNA polymerase sigma factor (TIGR02999 family)